MKKLFVLAVVLAVLLGGCATFGIFPKTNEGFTYDATINPDDVASGKYKVVNGGMINPWVYIEFYYQPERDRIVAGILVYNDQIKDVMLVRMFYIEKGRLVIIGKNDEKKAWEKVPLDSLGISAAGEVEIISQLVDMYETMKGIEKS